MAKRGSSSLILVLGGSGFVGRRLAHALGRAGYGVRVPTRNRARSRRLLVAPHVELIEADVHDESRLAELLAGCDAAVNLVGILNERGHDGAGFERAHTELARTVVRACRRAGVPRLLQMSSLKADAEHGPSHYLRSKGRAERAIVEESAGSVAYTIFRPSVIFGAEDSLLNRFAALLRWLPVLPLARASARFAPVFVDDVAAAFAVALENRATHGRTYELCGPDLYSLAELVRFVRAELGLRRAVVPLPDALGRFQAWAGEYLLPGKPLSLDNFASLGVASVCATDGLAELGIRPQSLAAIAPTFLGGPARHRRLAGLRRDARRG
jgi:NADH dehydrogenase